MSLIELETVTGIRCAIRPEFITHMLALSTGVEIWYGEKSLLVDANMDDLLTMIAECLAVEVPSANQRTVPNKA